MAFLFSELYEFLKVEGDKILLAGLIGVMLGILLHLAHHDASSPIIPWIEKSADLLLGSLITLITGRLIRRPEGK